DRAGAPEESELRKLPAVSRVAFEDEAVVLYTSDVAATIGALLSLTSRAGTEPENLMIRRASLEDVFLELTGRALRD
ncbi:MAG: type transport system ATP-binding protein, partial [Gaiellales bacterium]|nr:type transport system ATP-binding protein [Gaiellales bacterium]